MSRITRPQWYMELAQATARRSTCCRLNVGAVAVIDRNPVAFGYNGRESGLPHCQGDECPGKDACHETIHAEVNALERIPTSLRGRSCDLYVTDSPCAACCAHIVARGVARVFFANPYRLVDHLILLDRMGVGVYRVLPAGYVMEWFTRQLVGYEA